MIGPSGASTAPAKPGRVGRGWGWVTAAALVALISTIAALRQEPRAVPGRAPDRWTWKWFTSPIESRADRKLPGFGMDLYAVAIQHVNFKDRGPGARVWVAGESGTLMFSEDGKKWTKKDLYVGPVAPPTTNPAELPNAPAPAFPPTASPPEKREKSASKPSAAAAMIAPLESDRAPLPEMLAEALPQQQSQRVPANQDNAPRRVNDAVPNSPTRDLANQSAQQTRINSKQPAAPTTSTIANPQPATTQSATTSDNGAVARNDFYSVLFDDNGIFGGVIGEGQFATFTEDSGETWSQWQVPAGEWNFSLSSRIFHTTEPRRIEMTIDAFPEVGLLNTSQGILPEAQIKSIAVTDFQFGWAVGDRGEIRHTTDNGKKWEKQSANGRWNLRSVSALNNRAAWAVGEGGVILRITDGEHWFAAPSGTNYRLNGIAFADKDHGYAVGDHGTILASDDGGRSWYRLSADWWRDLPDGVKSQADATPATTQPAAAATQPMASAPPVSSAQPMATTRPSPRIGSARILAALYPDKSDMPQLPATKYPAPWYYASWIVVGLLLLPTQLRGKKQAKEDEEPSVGDALNRDSPLTGKDPDALGFKEIALGLSRFFRNTNTKPPLTLAVCGEWGSGKSSLMNLMKEDLDKWGVRPIWFNAWHHQKEEHLLAALLQAIKNDAVPPIYDIRLRGLRFRWNLVRLRTKRYWFILLVLGVTLCATAGYLSRNPHEVRILLHRVTTPTTKPVATTQPAEQAGGSSTSEAQGEGDVKPGESLSMDAVLQWLEDESKSLGTGGALVAMIASIAGLLKTGTASLRAFGTDPAKLMASLSDKSRITDLAEQTTVRQRFAREFKDVTKALDLYNMTIFIDDLDRCRPENVLEVLEAINFLVSSGECFVVLGMDSRVVQHCIGVAFAKVAQDVEFDEEKTLPPGTDIKQARRQDFARRYLEKLVQMQVQIPPLHEDTYANVIAPEPETPKVLKGWAKAGDTGLQIVKLVWKPALALVIAVAAFLGGWSIVSPQVEAAPPLNFALAGDRVPTTGPSPATEAVANADSTTKPATTQPAVVIVDRPAPIGFTAGAVRLGLATAAPVAAGMGALGLAVLALYIARPPGVVKDSKLFVDAVRQWLPVGVSPRQTTPRKLKQFMNWVRFLAMRQRPPEQAKSTIEMFGESAAGAAQYWRSAALWMKKQWPSLSDELIPREAHKNPGTRIPEDLMVICCCLEKWKGVNFEKMDVIGLAADLRGRGLLKQEEALVARWPEIKAVAPQYRKLMRGVGMMG